MSGHRPGAVARVTTQGVASCPVGTVLSGRGPVACVDAG